MNLFVYREKSLLHGLVCVIRKFVPNVMLACSLGAGSSVAADTVIREDEFTLTLPGGWSGGYDAGSRTWHYRTPKDNEGITIGILQRANGVTPPDIQTDFEIYLRVRREQELKLAGTEFTLAEPIRFEQQGAHIATFDGSDGVTRRTRTLVIVNQSVAASFYYEALALSADDFEQRASAILKKVGLIQFK